MLSKIVFPVVLFMFCTSCHQNTKNDRTATQQERELAEKLPLKERYDLYQSVFDRARPPDITLADEVAKLGAPAFNLAVNKAKTGSPNEIDSAIDVIGLTVLSGVGRCSSEDLRDIWKNVHDQFTNNATAQIVYRRVKFACSRKRPTN